MTSIKSIASVSMLLSIGVGNAFTTPETKLQIVQPVTDRLRPQGPVFTLRAGLSKPETKLLAGQATKNETGAERGNVSLLPSAIFLLSSASMALLAFEIRGSSSLPNTVGVWALFWTSLALFWDNGIIGIGKLLFSDVDTNESKFNLLKTLSYPRFTAHAVFVPFLYTTAAEIGKAMNIDWLQGTSTQTLMIVAAAVLGIVSRVRFVNSEGIELADTSDSPPNAWERDLVWFTYVKADFLYILPAVFLALLNLVVGVAGFMEGTHQDAAIFMIVAGAAVLYGNAKPSYVMRFTGNIAECVMLWATYFAATSVL